MGKPNYRVVVSFDRERNVFGARSPELDHLTGEGSTRAEAIARLEEEMDAQLANMLSHGSTPPTAVDDVEHSGQIQAKLSRTLHRDLAYLAKHEGVELDQLIGELLASAMAHRQGTRPARTRGNGEAHGNQAAQHGLQADDIGNRADGYGGGGGHRRFGGGRGGNAQMLDDRANFIEYVRGLEHQNGNHHARGGQGGHGGGHGGGHAGGHGGHGGQPGGGRRRRGRGGGGQNGPQQRDGNRGGGPRPFGAQGGGHPGNAQAGGQRPSQPQGSGGGSHEPARVPQSNPSEPRES